MENTLAYNYSKSFFSHEKVQMLKYKHIFRRVLQLLNQPSSNSSLVQHFLSPTSSSQGWAGVIWLSGKTDTDLGHSRCAVATQRKVVSIPTEPGTPHRNQSYFNHIIPTDYPLPAFLAPQQHWLAVIYNEISRVNFTLFYAAALFWIRLAKRL